MARFVLALVAVSVTICLTSIIHAAPQDNLVGKVFFLEGGKQEYLRQSISEGDVEDEVIYGEDTAAAIAVLLGVPPSLKLSSDSSARLDSLLSPNPFKRPHAVVALTIRGITSESPVVEEMEKILGSSPTATQRLISADAFQRPQELPGRDVSLHALNYGEYTHGLTKGLEDLAMFLEGFLENDEESDKFVLSIPLPLANGISVSIDLGERADRQFAKELLSLFHAIQTVPQTVRTQANLLLGTFRALELMEEGSQHRQDAATLFLHTAARVCSTLEEKYNGQIVGVVTLLSPTSEIQVPLFSIMESRSSRSLLDESLAPTPSQVPLNQSIYDKEIKELLSRSILVVTTLILLIATGLGSCFLFSMPLTRDTLLYANVKLD
ncbi:unnamed protein product [Calypogeia fissa]